MPNVTERAYPAISTNPEIERYWQEARAGRLLIKHCNGCNKPHFYPRSICPRCMSDATEWRAASGKGTIYSYSAMRRSKEPYVIAFVTLEEGVRMMTNIVDTDIDSVRIGQAVVLRWRTSEDGTPIPVFAPAAA
jgi:uncharacterized OB-fold protein